MQKAWFSLVLAVSMLATSPAFAQNQNEDFGKSAVAHSLMAKASKSQTVSEKKVIKPVESARPYEIQESIPEDVDSLMERVEEQNSVLVEEFEQLLVKDPLNPDAPKWLSQIAEFHWQTAHYSYLRARRAWMTELDKCAENESSCPPEPVADYSQSIADYRRLLTQYPNYAHTDDILFRLGDALIRNKQPKEGIGYLHRLTQTYPNYKDLDAAYLAMGEFYFSQKNTGTAQAAYQTIIDQYPNSTYFQYAQYKLAWTYLNLAEEEDYQKAIILFKQVVESIDSRYASAIDVNGQIDENKLKAGEVSFRNQALNDLSTTYAELPGGWKLARDYLNSKLPPDKARDKIEQLGGILDAQGKFEEEIELYNELIAQNPTHPHLFTWYTANIEAYKQANQMAEADTETRRTITATLPDSAWYKANENTHPAEIKLARQFCTFQMYSIAVNDIATIEKTPESKKDELWKDAENMLRLILKHFDEGPSSFDFHYSFAYVLDERSDSALASLKKQYGKKLSSDPSLASDVLIKLKEAAKAYQTVIDWSQPDEEQAEQIKVAANRQVFVYANILATSDPEWSIINSAKATNFVEEKRGSEIHEKEALSDAELGFVRSAEQYASRYPKDEETPAFLWRAAEIYRSRYDYDQAAHRFDEIISNFPDHQYAAVSVGSMFELYNKAQNYEKIEYWAKWLIEHKNFKHYTVTELEDTASFAIDKQAVAFADNHDIDKAVSTIMRIETSFPERKEHVTAARLKAAAFEESRKNYIHAIGYLQPLETTADTDFNKAEATWRIALNYYKSYRYENSLESFEQAADKYLSLMNLPEKTEVKANTKSKKNTKKNAEPTESQNAIKGEVPSRFAQSVLYCAQIAQSLKNTEKSAALLDKYIQMNTDQSFNLYKVGDSLKLHSEVDSDSPRIEILSLVIATLERASIDAEKQPDEAISRLSAYVDSDDFSRIPPEMQRKVIFQWAQIAADAGNSSQTDRALSKLTPDESSWSNIENARYAYLKGRLAQMDFESVVLEFPIRTLRKRIEEKAKKRQNAEKFYQQAISYKNASVSTAAAYELAQMALHFRDAFRNLPPPKELENDPAALDDYNVWIEDELIFPAEDAAASLLDVAHQITLQLESYTKYARQSAQTLAELKPDLYPVSKPSE